MTPAQMVLHLRQDRRQEVSAGIMRLKTFMTDFFGVCGCHVLCGHVQCAWRVTCASKARCMNAKACLSHHLSP